MGQVSVTLNGRTYRLRCGDGEEERLLSVTAHIGGHVDRLIQEHGQIGDERLILMAAILITDELFDLREAAASITSKPDTDAQFQQLAAAPRMQPQGSSPAAQTIGSIPPPAIPPPLKMSASVIAHGTAARPSEHSHPIAPTVAATPIVAATEMAAARDGAPTPLETAPGAAARLESAMVPTSATLAPLQAAVYPSGSAGKPLALGARGLDHLDATALMKGIENKAGRS